MNSLFAAFFGGWEIILILAVILILFGAKRLPELAKGLGQGIKEFKKATRDVSEEIQGAMDVEDHEPPRKVSYSQPEQTQPISQAQSAADPAEPVAHTSADQPKD